MPLRCYSAFSPLGLYPGYETKELTLTRNSGTIDLASIQYFYKFKGWLFKGKLSSHMEVSSGIERRSKVGDGGTKNGTSSSYYGPAVF